MNNIEDKNISIFERHPRKTIFCFFVAAILILDFLSANIYSFFNGYIWASRQEEQQKIKKQESEGNYRISSKFYHHDLAPKKNIHGATFGPIIYNVCTNSLGFKDKSIRDISLTPDKYRIVFMGDSFTEGIGVDYENTFVGLIDAGLSKKGIEVLNAGVAGYSPIIYWRKVKYLIENVGLRFNQLVVFIDLSDAQDEVIYYCLDESGNVVMYSAREQWPAEEKVEKYYKTLYERFHVFTKNNSILLYTLLHAPRVLFFPNESAPPTLELRSWTFDDKLYKEYGEQGLREMQLYMDKLYDLIKRNNIKLTVAVYPHPCNIMSQDLNSIQATFWGKWCKRHDVNFINYFPYFVTGNTENDRKQVVDKYFIKNDVHWNEKGHRLIADMFLADYEKQK